MVIRRPWGAAATIDGVPIIGLGESDYGSGFSFASGDAKVSKDGGSKANLGTLPAETPASSKMFRLVFTDTEMEASRIVVDIIDQSDPKVFEDQRVIIETELVEGAVGAAVTTGGAAATTIATSLSGSVDLYTNLLCVPTTGANAGCVRKVTGYNTSTKTLTFASAFPSNFTTGDKFVLRNR